MQYKTKTALAAVATVLAHPFRALFAVSKPHLTLTAPTLTPRGGTVDILADLGEFGTIDTSPTLREIVAATPRSIIGSPIRADVGGDPAAMMKQFQAAFEEFKKTNDANVGAKADGAEVTEKLGKINETVDIAGNQHQVVSVAREPTGVPGPQARGGAGDQGGRTWHPATLSARGTRQT